LEYDPMQCLGLAAAILISIPTNAFAWNIPTHMITGAIAYQTLQREDPEKIITVSLMLQRHPWYAGRWRGQLDKISGPERLEILFMLAARWADDVRRHDRAQDRPSWHYINLSFKPEGELASIRAKPPDSVNILSALAENKRILRREAPIEQRAIALAWLFHLVGDIHQPLHTAQLFGREYPDGDRGGNEICVRVTPELAPLNLHALWDGLVTSSKNVGHIEKMSTELRNKFPRGELTELSNSEPEAWAKESFGAAIKVAYQHGAIRGDPKGQRRDCREVADAAVLPTGYAGKARVVADRRILLAGYRLASVLERVLGK
jgi:hypothetical protein